MVLLHHAALLERGQKARSRRLVKSETSREFGDPGLPIPVPKGDEEGCGTVDRPYFALVRHPTVHRNQRGGGDMFKCRCRIHNQGASQVGWQATYAPLPWRVGVGGLVLRG